jgi:prevent-host-death family protein
MTKMITVSATQFQNQAGVYLKRGSGTVVVTRYNRPLKVILDYEEFERLKAMASDRPTRKAMRVEFLPKDALDALRSADFSHIDPELNKLTE